MRKNEKSWETLKKVKRVGKKLKKVNYFSKKWKELKKWKTLKKSEKSFDKVGINGKNLKRGEKVEKL